MNRLLWTLPLLFGAALSQTSKPAVIKKVGDVSLSWTRVAMEGMPAQEHAAVTASFFRGAAPLTGPATRDTCAVQTAGHDGPTLPSVPSDAAPLETPVFLDAGTPLVLRSGTKTYTPINRTRQGPRIAYATPAPTLPAPPAKLVLDVPGMAGVGGFPAFHNVAVPVSDLPRLTAPLVEDDVTLSTTFRWSNPTRNPAATVMLMGMSDEPELVFSCSVQDDGTFNFPAAFVSQLKAKGFETGQLTMIGRTTSSTVRSGDAALSLRSSVFEMRSGR